MKEQQLIFKRSQLEYICCSPLGNLHIFLQTTKPTQAEAVAEAGTDQEAEGKIEDADIKEEQAEILDKEAVKEDANIIPENPGNPGIK